LTPPGTDCQPWRKRIFMRANTSAHRNRIEEIVALPRSGPGNCMDVTPVLDGRMSVLAKRGAGLVGEEF
jgi:hypothetical protein